MSSPWRYPRVRRDDTSRDDYHGTIVDDPYRWLEDPDADETKSFVEAQNALTKPFIAESELRDRYHARMTELYDYPKYGCPFKRGDKYYYYKNTGLQNQYVMYWQDDLKSEGSVFLDPNEWSEDGTIALKGKAFSEDGSLLAYGKSSSGSDWLDIHVLKVDSREEMTDVLTQVKFTSMAWTHDNKGFFYNRYPEAGVNADGTETDINLNQKLYYHVIGTDQKEDVLCCEFPDNPKWMIGAEVTDDGQYLILTVCEGCDPVNRLYYCDLSQLPNGINGLLPYVKLVDNFDAEYEYIANNGTLFTFKTNLKSPRYKLINIDISAPEMEKWTDLVEEHEKDVLNWAACVNKDFLVLCYLHDVKSVLHLHHLNTGARCLTFPLDIGTVCGFSGRRKSTEVFYHFTSFLTPGIIYHCDLTKETLEPTVFRQIEVKGFDASKFETNQVFYETKDKTAIPMFIVHKKNLNLDSSHPCYLYGYGGFNISITPSFSTSRLIFIQNMGGVLAIPNIRGGGEYGEDWHQAGMLGKKQNVFDDFHAAAEFVVEKGYTTSKKLVICGGSNGGLLVGACANQRPELYKCVVAHVGVMDMLKFHKFTIGHAWTTDYGCSDKKEEFEWLIKYSPLHNVKVPPGDVQYPATLLLTGDHDDRVVPLHSLKFASELQYVLGAEPKQTNPLMILVDTKSGHGAGKPTGKIINETSDIYGFIARILDIAWIE